MKDHYPLIAGLKGVDVCLQLLCFAFIAASVIVYEDEEAFGIGLLAITGYQLFSAIFWSFTLYKERFKMFGGVFIRNTLLVVFLLLLVIYYVFRNDFGMKAIIVCVILVIGPLLVMSYFIITIGEIHYYKKLARKG